MHRYIKSFIIIFFCISLLATKPTNSALTDNKEKQQEFEIESNLEPTGYYKDQPEFTANELDLGVKTKFKIAMNNLSIVQKLIIPSAFDATEKWGKCNILGDSLLYHKDNKKTSWAVIVASVLADRICVAQNGKFKDLISVQELLSCCINCEYIILDRKSSITKAWEYYRDFGALTDRQFDIYFNKCPAEHPDNCGLAHRKRITEIYTLIDIKEIQKDIMRNGPVSALLRIYDRRYTEGESVPDFSTKNEMHAVKIFGWGKKDGKPYWLCAKPYNSNLRARTFIVYITSNYLFNGEVTVGKVSN